MDWVLKAAKRKNKRAPGSSRSIIESLNIFNEVVDEGQSELSSILNGVDFWTKDESEIRIMDTKKDMRLIDETSSMVSPEKTQSTFEVKASGMTSRQNTFSEPSGTPKRASQDLPTTTPKSLAEDNSTEDVDKMNLEEADTTIGENDKKKMPVWSPYRTGKGPKSEDAKGGTAIHTEIKDLQLSPYMILQHPENKVQVNDSVTTSPSEKKMDQAVKDRSQRRSNMFVPLPSKDPLIVQHALPEVSEINKSSIPTYAPAGSSSYNQHQIKVTSAEKQTKRTSLTFQQTPSFPFKHRVSISRKTQSPQSTVGSFTSTGVSKATTSVFDRLSSLPTKSFEKKITNRSSERKVSSSSSIDVTGSPMRRTPLSVPSSGHTDASIQETLKNIFSSKSANYKVVKPSALSSTNSARFLKSDTIHRSINKFKKNSQYEGKNLQLRHEKDLLTSSVSSNNGIPKDERGRTASGSKINCNPKFEIPSNSQITGVKDVEDGKDRKQYELTSYKGSSKRDVDLFGNDGFSQHDHDVARGRKSRNHDRLTKFQLLPPIESEKADLQRKLSKRLSEVMRTQQNQQRRRFEQQKRKSHLEEDFNRRTRLWNESKEAAPTATPNSASIYDHATATRPEQNSVLYDLNVVDHRNIIGEDSARRNKPKLHESEIANQTLPEINSDSEDEIETTLPSWARSPYLKEQLYLQQSWDPKKIFGAIPPLHIDQIFQGSRLNRLKSRQSSNKKP